MNNKKIQKCSFTCERISLLGYYSLPFQLPFSDPAKMKGPCVDTGQSLGVA